MITEDTLKKISSIFCGDEEGYFSYKTGSQLVSFFRDYFGYNDVYGPGFPSRWVYVNNKLVDFISSGKFDRFLNLVLGKQYLIADLGISEAEAVQQSSKILEELNRIFKRDLHIITKKNDSYHLVAENSDLVSIGNGGFANVYKQKSTGLIVKKLKDDYVTDNGIRSRFKREFEITNSLQDLWGIIRVYEYLESSYSYTMEEAERTLYDYITSCELLEETKVICIQQILYIMTKVHERNIIHRDISPSNIFLIQGKFKIADFGLGKDLNIFSSHQTINTNSFGQFFYCAPEQFMLLKEGDMRSDVYSLGRIINFIMTGNPTDSHHIFRSVSEKAANHDAAYRFENAGELARFFERSVAFHKDKQNEVQVFGKIEKLEFDSDVEDYIYELSSERLANYLLESKPGFADSLIIFMKCDDAHAEHIIKSIELAYRDVCGREFSAYDPFAQLSYDILVNEFSFIVKELAAKILKYVAYTVNRYNAQDLISAVKEYGVEPLIEEIFD